ncbi:MAG: DEAD/DEAH box helicase family protein [Bacteroidia bacterium]|nr:DEAD/DEAH box helicase family protein [Bacteroidia bacterium]
MELRGAKYKLFEGERTIKNIVETEINISGQFANYKIKSEGTDEIYTVNIDNFENKEIRSKCNCPFDYSGMCKHQVATLLDLAEKLVTGQTGGKNILTTHIHDKYLPKADPVNYLKAFPFSEINLETAVKITNQRDVYIMKSLVSSQDIIAWLQTKGLVNFKQTGYKNPFNGTLKLVADEIIPVCSCQQSKSKICGHALAALHLIKGEHGTKAFTEGQSLEDLKLNFKNKYGIPEKEEIDSQINVSIINGVLTVNKNHNNFFSVDELQKFNSFETDQHENFMHLQKRDVNEIKKIPAIITYAFENNYDSPFNSIILTNFITQNPIKLDSKQYFTGKKYELSDEDKLAITDIEDTSGLKKWGLNLDSKFLFKFIKEFKLTESKSQSIDKYKKDDFASKNFQIIEEYIRDSYENILLLLQDYQKGIFINEDGFPGYLYKTRTTCKLHQYQQTPATIEFNITEKENSIIITPEISFGSIKYPIQSLTAFGFWMLIEKGKNSLRLFKNYFHAQAYHDFKTLPPLVVKKPLFNDFTINVLPKIIKHFKVTVDPTLMTKTKDKNSLIPQPKLYLKELNGALLLIPNFAYTLGQNTIETEWSDGTILVDPIKPKPVIYNRNKEIEESLFEFVRSLHPDFIKNKYQSFFHLQAKEVINEQWFFKAIALLQEKGFEVLGQSELKSFKYNLNKPTLKFGQGSGLDWFDLTVSVQFGDLNVALKEIKKALINRQNYITLSDGTIGILPEEWFRKYAAIFQTGEVKAEGIKLSKMHFNLLTEISEEFNNEELSREIFQKKEKLLNFKQIKKTKLPKNIKATMRDYQMEGYNWLNFLDEFNWGGCLADDMGLGKTLQAITLLAKQKEKKKNQTSLVIVPTTLIFNWVNEIEKFCPDMDVYVHRGFQRSDNLEAAFKHDVILTTYGTIRSDIDIFKNHTYNYIILDESQAIKNPAAQISKAVKLLKGKNRLVMTGTPVENNTFDLYSQLDFVNPGLLGSQEHFRETYATPIDKYKDEFKAQQLRQLIYPFILKRNKQTVAKELPEKTEMILYCEMGKEQRKVYDTFKNLYRKRIEESIEENGLGKSGFLILEGLTKLRQICDSPQLLNDDITYTHESAKLEEIEREITENAGHHKIIVFSQFLKMLDLIKTALEKHNIPFSYLDGQTKDRADKVNKFQEDENCRVFLISLKAGGVGLNLTEADYVYLVDPWWNPAVENQAIDRAHRIGQTKKVFAYRMICKDTIEEKIVELQKKKKMVADSLINTESGFMKKLSKEDISSLFI